MQVGHLPRSRTKRDMRDNAVLQGLRILLVAGLMAGGSLALWRSGIGGSSAEGMIAAAPPETIPSEPQNSRPARVHVADAAPAAPVAIPAPEPEPVAIPEAAPKDPARAPAMEAQAAGIPERTIAAPPAPPVPARPDDMNMTGTIAKQASLAEPAAAETSAAAGQALVDLNTASFAQLNSLKGAGAMGRAIIRGRPYASVEDLVTKRIVRRNVYERIKEQVTVR